MSYYRNKLQNMMLKSSVNLSTSQPFNFSTFYAVCETVGYAAMLTGWLGAILSHL